MSTPSKRAHSKTDRDAFLRYLERICRRSSHTIRSYETGLTQLADFLRRRHKCYRSATFEDLLDYAATLHDAKPATAQNRISAMQSLYRFLQAMGHVERNFAALVPKPKRQRGRRPSHDVNAVEAVRAAIPQCAHRDRALFGLMYDSLCRISEVRFLLVDDVDLVNRRVIVLGKGDKLRTVGLSADTTRALESWIQHRHRQNSRYVFPGYHDGRHQALTEDLPISVVPIYGMLERAVKAAGARGRWTPHALRRSMSRHLHDEGTPLDAIQEEMGHESAHQTLDYIRASAPQAITDELRARIAARAQETTPVELDPTGTQ
jgi:integrase/recombinase XerC